MLSIKKMCRKTYNYCDDDYVVVMVMLVMMIMTMMMNVMCPLLVES